MPFQIFVKTITNLVDKREKVFGKSQEAFSKGAKRVYAVLFSRWHIFASRSRIWATSDMELIVHCCVILHTMIVEASDFEDEEIARIDENAAIVPIRMRIIPNDMHDYSDYLQATADFC